MRRIAVSWLGALAIALAAGAVSAATLTTASWLQVTEGFPMTRTLVQLGAAGSSTASSIAVTLSYPPFTTGFFVPKGSMGPALSLHVQISQGGSQALTATPSMAAADMGVPGSVIVRTATHASTGVSQSAFGIGAKTLVQIPLNVGASSQFLDTFTVFDLYRPPGS